VGRRVIESTLCSTGGQARRARCHESVSRLMVFPVILLLLQADARDTTRVLEAHWSPTDLILPTDTICAEAHIICYHARGATKHMFPKYSRHVAQHQTLPVPEPGAMSLVVWEALSNHH